MLFYLTMKQVLCSNFKTFNVLDALLNANSPAIGPSPLTGRQARQESKNRDYLPRLSGEPINLIFRDMLRLLLINLKTAVVKLSSISGGKINLLETQISFLKHFCFFQKTEYTYVHFLSSDVFLYQE